MTPLVDQLRSEERSLIANQWFSRLWPWGLAVAMFGWGFVVGVRHPDPTMTDQAVKIALQHNADSLRAVHAKADALRRVDSATSVVVASARESVTVHQSAVSHAASQVSVSPVVTDSAVRVQRPATDSTPKDTTLILPLEIASFIREAKPQLVRDSVALHADTLLLAVKDSEIVTLRHADTLWQHRDSTHVDNEKRLTKERDSAFRRGLLAGVKGTVTVASLVFIVAKVVALGRH